MPNQTMVYSCSGAEQEYTMVWFGIFLYLLISSLKIRFCEQSVFAKSPLHYGFPKLGSHLRRGGGELGGKLSVGESGIRQLSLHKHFLLRKILRQF